MISLPAHLAHIETPAGMKAFMVTVKADYRKDARLVHAKTAAAAANKSRRIWPRCPVLSVEEAK